MARVCAAQARCSRHSGVLCPPPEVLAKERLRFLGDTAALLHPQRAVSDGPRMSAWWTLRVGDLRLGQEGCGQPWRTLGVLHSSRTRLGRR